MQEHSQTFVLLFKAPGGLSGLGCTWDSEELGALGGTGEQVRPEKAGLGHWYLSGFIRRSNSTKLACSFQFCLSDLEITRVQGQNLGFLSCRLVPCSFH